MCDETERLIADDPEELAVVRSLFCALFASRTLSDCIELSIEGTGELNLNRRGFTYGETGLKALLTMLQAAELQSYCCNCVPLRALAGDQRCTECGRRFAGAAVVDLGSGIGNLVVGAALLAAAKLVRVSSVCGVELLPPLHHAAVAIISELTSRGDSGRVSLPAPLPPCRLACEDLTMFDISDADVCYLCSTIMTNETINRFSDHAAATMRLGSRGKTTPLEHTHSADF